MGLFDRIFGKNKTIKKVESYFKTFDGYKPVFRNWNGALYESELVRASVNTIAKHISKVHIRFEGTARDFEKNSLKYAPNPFQTWGQWLYRTATILYIQNNAYIVPSRDVYGRINGIYTILPSECGVARDKNDNVYLTYKFKSGETGACEINQCGILTRHQYESDFFGSSQKALTPTMELISMMNQSIEEATRSSATYRFIGEVTNFLDDKDLQEARENFNKNNFGTMEGTGGLLLIPREFTNVKQLTQTPFVVSAEQKKNIENNVFNYFGVNEKLLQNLATDEELDSFFDGEIEPFMIQLSEVLTRMLYNGKEYARNRVIVDASRLQYMSTPHKLNFIDIFSNRGMMKVNEAREIMNLPPLEDGGELMPIRGEYYDAKEKQKEDTNDGEEQTEQDD